MNPNDSFIDETTPFKKKNINETGLKITQVMNTHKYKTRFQECHTLIS